MNVGILIVGVVMLCLGLYAGAYTVEVDNGIFGEDLENPYQMYSIPLFIGGIVLIVVGGFIGSTIHGGKST